mgnify:FL=1
MKTLTGVLILLIASVLTACETSDATLQDQGRSHSYILGFHDGRHSGISEAGNPFDHYIRDEDRFVHNNEYKQGWLDGETEGKKLQAQAASAGAVLGAATAAANVNKEVKKNQDFDKIGEDALKGTDTSTLKNLGN